MDDNPTYDDFRRWEREGLEHLLLSARERGIEREIDALEKLLEDPHEKDAVIDHDFDFGAGS